MNTLNKIMNIDPLTEAEQLHAAGYPGADVNLTALGIQMMKSRAMESLLKNADDTTFSNSFENYTRIIQSLGFEYCAQFPLHRVDYKGVKEEKVDSIQVYANRENGCVIVLDTYAYDSEEAKAEVVNINNATLYFSWKGNDSSKRPRCSGGLESPSNPEWRRDPKYFVEQEDGSYKNYYPDDLFTAGDFGEQMAIRNKLDWLKENGQFLTPWPFVKADSRGSMLLVEGDYRSNCVDGQAHSAATRAYHKHIQRERFAQVPDWCKAIINGNYLEV